MRRFETGRVREEKTLNSFLISRTLSSSRPVSRGKSNAPRADGQLMRRKDAAFESELNIFFKNYYDCYYYLVVGREESHTLVALGDGSWTVEIFCFVLLEMKTRPPDFQLCREALFSGKKFKKKKISKLRRPPSSLCNLQLDWRHFTEAICRRQTFPFRCTVHSAE